MACPSLSPIVSASPAQGSTWIGQGRQSRVIAWSSGWSTIDCPPCLSSCCWYSAVSAALQRSRRSIECFWFWGNSDLFSFGGSMIGAVSWQDLCSELSRSVETCSGCLLSLRTAACRRSRFGLRRGWRQRTENFAYEHPAGHWMTPACESQWVISSRHWATFILYTLFDK